MLMNMKELLKVADEKGFAVPAFNIGSDQLLKAVMQQVKEMKSPVILEMSPDEFNFVENSLIQSMIYEASKTDVPVVIHLDHGDKYETVVRAIQAGFTSVMIDASSKPFEENVALTRQVVEYAHAHGAVVEAELGTLAGIEDDVKVKAEDSSYTRPEDVQEFVERTGCDSLAIAIGTSHGAYKFKPGTKPQLRFDILEEVSERLPGFPIVLHGSSSVPQEYVQMINEFGGAMPGAIGVPEDQLRQAARLAVCKINIDSDLRLAMTGTIRKYLAEHPAEFDPRKYLGPARENIKQLVKHKIVDVLGCDGKA